MECKKAVARFESGVKKHSSIRKKDSSLSACQLIDKRAKLIGLNQVQVKETKEKEREKERDLWVNFVLFPSHWQAWHECTVVVLVQPPSNAWSTTNGSGRYFAIHLIPHFEPEPPPSPFNFPSALLLFCFSRISAHSKSIGLGPGWGPETAGSCARSWRRRARSYYLQAWILGRLLRGFQEENRLENDEWVLTSHAITQPCLARKDSKRETQEHTSRYIW